VAAQPRSDGWVTPDQLDDKTKNELWIGLKSIDPALADMLKTDPNLTALKNAFSATVRFTRENARQYVIEGRRILEERRNAIP
jgi:hypothetical protein